MKGFSKSIAYRYQPIWKIKNQTGSGSKQTINENTQNIENRSEQFYDPPINIEKCKKRSKKHKKRKREYQNMDY